MKIPQSEEQVEIQESYKLEEINSGGQKTRFSGLVWVSLLALAIPILGLLLLFGLKKIDQFRGKKTGAAPSEKMMIIEPVEPNPSVEMIDVKNEKLWPEKIGMLPSIADSGMVLTYDSHLLGKEATEPMVPYKEKRKLADSSDR